MKKGSKRVVIDPDFQRVIETTQWVRELSDAKRQGLEEGYASGYRDGKKMAAEMFFSDAAEMWAEVSKQASAAAKYASTISGMYRAQAPKKEQAK